MMCLRLYSPELSQQQRRIVARDLTNGVIRALHLPEQARAGITIHFMPYRLDDIAVGGEILSDLAEADHIVEISDRGLTWEKKDALNREMTPLLARLLGLELAQTSKINLIFRNYEPHDVAVGGRFFDDIGH
jgi:phenylpyruvate tautomerase PptA (4-oxalocrotonate tautomerase family)